MKIKESMLSKLDKIKYYSALIFLFYSLFGGLLFYLHYFGIIRNREIWEAVYGVGAASPNSPIFLGLCALAGAYLIANVKDRH